MEKQYLVLFVIIFSFISIHISHAQWDRVEALENSWSFDIGGDENIVVTNYSNKLTSSQNGGDDWDSNNKLFEFCWFTDVDFATESIAYACGGSNFGPSKNLIAKSTDGGITWDSLLANQSPGYDYRKIDMINEDTGFISQQYNLYLTLDGFETLEHIDIIGGTFKITAFDVFQNNIILIYTDLDPDYRHQYILQSSDLGSTWDTLYQNKQINPNPDDIKHVNSIQYFNNQDIYAVGANGLFLKSNDGGMNWQMKRISPFTTLSTVYFTSENTGYINNAGGIYKTINGGEDWYVQQINPLQIINEIIFVNDTLGYALGDNGVFKTTNGGDLSLSSDNSELPIELNIFPNPTSEYVNIVCNKTPYKLNLQLFNPTGELLLSRKLSKRQKIRTADYSPGVYYMNFYIMKSGKSLTKKLIISR